MFQEIQFSSQADCKLLECRNVTMQSVVKPFKIWGQTAISSSTAGRLFDCTVMVDPILINFGQYAIHSLNTAIQAWQQVCRSNSEGKKIVAILINSVANQDDSELNSFKEFQDIKIYTKSVPLQQGKLGDNDSFIYKSKCSLNSLSFNEMTWICIRLIRILVSKCTIFC